MNITTSASCSICTQFAQVGKLWSLVFAVLDGTRQLRQGQYRHRQFLGDRLQS